ncbi:unnamed protein product [Acanthosepion pharaonis]|uniref:Uncharacterized protein n=1 Tax=Acanthosepion pharaonis TaxID=158019 RepID=A0A812B6S1_ACAPH|nr:unnamed protein product [Sepia pharaonis]
MLNTVEPSSNGFKRLLTLRLNTTIGPVIFVTVYAPTLYATPDTKDEFYEKLAITISHIRRKEQLVLLSARFGVGKVNDNGQRLLELCTYHNFCMANYFFGTKPQHKVSWRHPRSKHWHRLDLILVRRATNKHVHHPRSYHSADCDTDHSFVCYKIKHQPKRYHRDKKQGHP